MSEEGTVVNCHANTFITSAALLTLVQLCSLLIQHPMIISTTRCPSEEEQGCQGAVDLKAKSSDCKAIA